MPTHVIPVVVETEARVVTEGRDEAQAGHGDAGDLQQSRLACRRAGIQPGIYMRWLSYTHLPVGSAGKGSGALASQSEPRRREEELKLTSCPVYDLASVRGVIVVWCDAQSD